MSLAVMATAFGLLMEDAKGVKHHLCEKEVESLPKNYILPITDRPNSSTTPSNRHQPKSQSTTKLPVLDLSLLHSPKTKPQALRSLAKACENYGFFQLVNHGIPDSLMKNMVGVGRRFFEQPYEERLRYMSADVRSPVRCGTSFINQVTDKILCLRDFLKLSCCPMPCVLQHWPLSPTDLREIGVSYATQTRNLFLILVEAVLETLGLVKTTRSILEDFKDGTHLMVVNSFPTCPEPELRLGMPPHSDYGFLSIVLQDGVKGLQIQSHGDWVTVEPVPNSIVVNVGDHLEIFSNGRYKSVLHRVMVNETKPRISVASIHSLPFHSVVTPCPELIDDQNPRLYMDTDFSAFLDFISSSQPEHKSFIGSRKITRRDEHEHPLDL